ncbi:MAG: XrtB/PEP-CTERM-associated polysaccharide biosynthesis outer membrane protein EpsL [Polaromonas sp.]
MLGFISLNVHADELDTVQFKAGVGVRYDSNIFRLSDSADAQAVLGTSKRSDMIAVTSVGIKLDKQYSLQRFEFDVNADRYSYKEFTNLDFTAVNYAAAWRWSLTPRLHGNLTTDRRQYIDNTADVQNSGQVNRRTNRSTLFDAEYGIGGPWRVVGGVFENNSTNSQLTSEGDSRVSGGEVGVRYVYASGTSLAYRLRHGSGEYPDRLSGNFKDREHEFRLDWPLSGKTTIQAQLSHFDRTHEGLSARDFSGILGQINATWEATGKTRVRAGFARELGSYQTASTNYYKGYRFFIAPSWKPTEKTAVLLRYDHGVRDFSPSNRRDTSNQGSLSFEWQAARAVKLSASILRDERNSNLPGFDFKSNGLNVSVLASF